MDQRFKATVSVTSKTPYWVTPPKPPDLFHDWLQREINRANHDLEVLLNDCVALQDTDKIDRIFLLVTEDGQRWPCSWLHPRN